jgi:hypothetical protein
MYSKILYWAEMKFLKFSLILFLILSVVSCGHRERTPRPITIQAASKGNLFTHRSEVFDWTDKAGRFELLRETGRSSEQNEYIVRQRLRLNEGRRDIVEQSVVISQLGNLRGRVDVMRPQRSQYTVWFEGDRYFTELEIETESKSMKVRMASPDSEWNGEKRVPFPDSNSVYCFFSSVVECAFYTGFVETALREKTGSMNFYLVWEGYPFFMEQYIEVPQELFTRAVLTYDGTEREPNRFSLRFAGQSLFLFINTAGRFDRLFWVGQGLSIVKRGAGN